MIRYDGGTFVIHGYSWIIWVEESKLGLGPVRFPVANWIKRKFFFKLLIQIHTIIIIALQYMPYFRILDKQYDKV